MKYNAEYYCRLMAGADARAHFPKTYIAHERIGGGNVRITNLTLTRHAVNFSRTVVKSAGKPLDAFPVHRDEFMQAVDYARKQFPNYLSEKGKEVTI